MVSRRALKWLMVAAVVVLIVDSLADMPMQELGITMNATPDVVTIVGDYYFINDDTNKPLPCGDGIPLEFSIKLLCSLAGGRAENDAYGVHLTVKLPYESELVQVKEMESDSSARLVPPYRGNESETYYRNSDDILYIYLDSIQSSDFPKEVRVKVKVPKEAAPSTLYASALLRSDNDINLTNNYATTNSYFGIAYSREYGLEGFEKLINKSF